MACIRVAHDANGGDTFSILAGLLPDLLLLISAQHRTLGHPNAGR